MLSGVTLEEYHHLVGRVQMLRTLAGLPESLGQYLAQKELTHARTGESVPQPDPHLNTPWWQPLASAGRENG